MITDVYNNISQRIGNNGQVTIGNITYTGKGVTNTNPKISIDKNGITYTPVTSGHPTKTTYTSGTVLSLGNGDHAEPVIILFSPN